MIKVAVAVAIAAVAVTAVAVTAIVVETVAIKTKLSLRNKRQGRRFNVQWSMGDKVTNVKRTSTLVGCSGFKLLFGYVLYHLLLLFWVSLLSVAVGVGSRLLLFLLPLLLLLLLVDATVVAC